MRSLIRSSIVVLSIFAFPVLAVAATTVPNTFTAGTPAKAADVNANFQALATAVDALSARVDKLAGTTAVTAADVVGTYTLNGFMVQVFKGPQAVGPGVYDTVGSGAVFGTATINSDGTGSIQFSIKFSQMSTPEYANVQLSTLTNINTAAVIQSNDLPPSVKNFTWTLTNNTFTSSVGMSMRLQPGAPVIVGNMVDQAQGMNGVFILTRN